MENQSSFDPSRKTVGAIYKETKESYTGGPVIVGDMRNELMKSLVDDINDCIERKTKEFHGEPFYIIVYEKKDMAMKTVIKRILFTFTKRPYPEADTIAFWIHPASNTVRFCWCLPPSHEMTNILQNPELFDLQTLTTCKAWKSHDLYCFGFRKDAEGHWEANPHFKDHPMEERSYGATVFRPAGI